MRLSGLIAVLFLCLPVFGQPAVYRVEIEVHDTTAGAAQPNQHYTMLVDESRPGHFEASNRIPATGAPGGATVDIGTKLECSVRPSGDKIDFQGSIELSRVEGNVGSGTLVEPIIGQTKVGFHQSVTGGASVPIGSAAGYHLAATVTRVESAPVQRPAQRVDGVVPKQ